MNEEVVKVEGYAEVAWAYLIKYGPKVLLAIAVLVVGLILIKWATKTINKIMTNRGVDESLRPFLIALIGVVLKVMLAVSVIQMLGVATTSFIAVIGAAGLAIGLALSGTLQNFAGGIIILLLKPFHVGDWIEAQGHSGTVSEVQIFMTILKTPDNRTIILPNGALSTGALVNYSTEPRRRVDMVFGAGYDADVDHVKATLQGIIDRDERILKDPAPAILLSGLADSSVNFTLRLWVENGGYWGVHFAFHENVKKVFDREKIGIPFPQMDVHLHKDA